MLHYLLELIIEIWQFEKIIIIQNLANSDHFFPWKILWIGGNHILSGRIFGENWPIEKRLLPTIVICETWLWCSCARKNMRASPPPVLSMWPWKPKPNENAQGGLLFFLLRLGRRGLFPMCSHYVPPPPAHD
jgi:hypothetical protein